MQDKIFQKYSEFLNNEKENIRQDACFKNLNLILTKLFQQHKYNLSDKFKKNVWFLKDNPIFQNQINSDNNFIEATEDDHLFRILRVISISGPQLNDLNVDVMRFINILSKSLQDSNLTKKNLQTMIKYYNMEEKKELIIKKINFIKEKIHHINSFSKIKFSVYNLENFPDGNYTLKLLYEAHKNGNEHKIENQHFVNLKEKQNINIKSNSKNKKKLEKSEYFETIHLNCEKNSVQPDLESFSLDNNKFHIDTSYAGITIDNFKFIIEKNGILFAITENEFLLDNFMDSVDCLVSDKIYHKSFVSYAYLDVNREKNSTNTDIKYEIYYDIEIEFEKFTNIIVLEKIYNIFQEIINTKEENEKTIEDILKYFPEIKNDIESALNEKKNLLQDNCGLCSKNCAIL